MARTLLDYCISEQTKPQAKEAAKAQAPVQPPQIQETAVIKPKKRQRQPFPPIAPENLPPSYFVSASYDGRQKKVVIKLYEPESGNIYFWYDNTGHKPYCLTNIAKSDLERFTRLVKHEGFDSFQEVVKFDPLNNENIKLTKILAKDPLAIGGRPAGTIRDIIPEDYPLVFGCKIHDSDSKVWESKIKYYQTYIYDRELLPGMIYAVKDGDLVPVVIEEASENLDKIKGLFKDCSDEERGFAEMWARLLEYPAPKFRRAAIDIEVYSPLSTRVPDAREGACPVIACSVYSSDGEKRVLVLKREGMQTGNPALTSGIEVE
jgi:DNA polymerase, archaea type